MRHEQAIARLNESIAELREYAGTDTAKAAFRMLDALAEVYRHDLVSTEPGDLVFRQAATKQVEALAKLFSGDVNADPRI